MRDRSFGRWVVDFLGCLVALVAIVTLVGLVIKLDLLVQKLMTIVIYMVVGMGMYLASQYIRSHRWSKKHAKKVVGGEPMDWERPSTFEQKMLQGGLIFILGGTLSIITIGGSFESFIREGVDMAISIIVG